MNSNTWAGVGLGCLGLLLIGTFGPCCLMLFSAPGGPSMGDGSALIYALVGFPLLMGLVSLIGGIVVYRKGREAPPPDGNDTETRQ